MARASIEPDASVLRGWPLKQINRPDEVTIKISDVEILSGKIRLWESDNPKYGEPYQWCGSIWWLDRETAEIGPYDKKILLSYYKAIAEECGRWGIKKVIATTYPNGPECEPKVREIITVPTAVQKFYEEE